MQNANRSDDPLEKYQFSSNASGVDWSIVDAIVLASAVAAVVSAGDALLFGRTQNGRAVTLTVCSGKRNKTEYFGDVDEVEIALRAIGVAAVGKDAYEGIRDAVRANTTVQKAKPPA